MKTTRHLDHTSFGWCWVMGSGCRTILPPFRSQPLISSMTVGKLPTLSAPQFLHLAQINSTHLTELLRRWNEILHVWVLAQCLLTHRECLIYVSCRCYVSQPAHSQLALLQTPGGCNSQEPPSLESYSLDIPLQSHSQVPHRD